MVNNYILLNKLGQGSYGEVRLAKEKATNTLFAMKIINKDTLRRRKMGKDYTSMDDVKREIAIMKKVAHPNVLRLYEVRILMYTKFNPTQPSLRLKLLHPIPYLSR